MKGATWFKFFASEALELSDGMTPEEGYKFFRQTCYALLGEETGRTSLADAMLARYEEDAEKNRIAARQRWGTGTPSQADTNANERPRTDTNACERMQTHADAMRTDADAMRMHADAYKTEEEETEDREREDFRPEDRRPKTEEGASGDIPRGVKTFGEALGPRKSILEAFLEEEEPAPKPAPKPPRPASRAGMAEEPPEVAAEVEEFLGNPKEVVWRDRGLRNQSLPYAMAAYCGRRKNAHDVNTFTKAVARDPVKARNVFGQFVAEMVAGEGERLGNWAAVLTKRLGDAGLLGSAA